MGVGSRAMGVGAWEGRIRVCKQYEGSLTRVSTILIGCKGGSIDRGSQGTHTPARWRSMGCDYGCVYTCAHVRRGVVWKRSIDGS